VGERLDGSDGGGREAVGICWWGSVWASSSVQECVGGTRVADVAVMKQAKDAQPEGLQSSRLRVNVV